MFQSFKVHGNKSKLQRRLKKKSVGPTIITGNALCRSIEQLLEKKKTNRKMFPSGEIVLQARKGQRGTKNTKDARVYILAASQDPI